MTEKRKQEVLKAFEEILKAEEVIRSYSCHAHERGNDEEPVISAYFDENLYITKGFFDIAEALGITPTKGSVGVNCGWICEEYSFQYENYKVWTSVKVRRLEDWNE